MNMNQVLPRYDRVEEEDEGAPRGKRALHIAHQIVDEIAHGSFEPGDRLACEQEMLERYGVARATLREALRFLELQGVISLKPGPGGGPVVREPKPSNFASSMALILQFVGAEFRSLIEVRRAISPSMAAHAARRATKDDIDSLQTAIERMEKLPSDSPAYVEEHRRFHDLAAWASHNPLIGFLVVALHHLTTESGINLVYTETESIAQLKAYKRILLAIKERDEELAFLEMHRFMRRSDRHLEKKYPHLMSKRVHWDDASNIISTARRRYFEASFAELGR